MPCAIEDCEDTGRLVRGWCLNHYYRWRKHGDPLGGHTGNGVAIAYYWAHVDDETDECILWPFAKRDGYGKLGQDMVHILACTRHHGPKPSGDWIAAAHAPVICHQRACFNQRHLSWKTYTENNHDMVLDGTYSPPPNRWQL